MEIDPVIQNNALVLPEGMTKRELKAWLRENKKKFFHPKRRSTAQFKKTIELHQRLQDSKKKKELYQKLADGKLTSLGITQSNVIRTK